ncbi:flavin reductase [Streptomyces sp. NPDC048257]|uniref:flavin reductase n=1 Tax=Streptomyces sp. NPDC048257 TaxID=3365526 RepID=UPI00371DAF7F
MRAAGGFAVTGGDRFAGIPWRPASNGTPLLGGVLASVECESADVLGGGGDHAIEQGRA